MIQRGKRKAVRRNPIFTLIKATDVVTKLSRLSFIYANQRNNTGDCCFLSSALRPWWNLSALSVLVSTALLSFRALCLWSRTEVMMGGKQWKPQRAWSGTSQMKAIPRLLPVILISPAFAHARIEINPVFLSPPHVYLRLFHNRGQTGRRQRGPVASDTLLPLPLSSAIFCRCSRFSSGPYFC